ncbi:MAG: hypothetical protein RI572_08460 [Salegentibacter sp.]|uniref:hypothetical protein n=1 Tax=Salegentibacter sp. TaxID=1903072 RepID=UPI00286FF77A|nr:hypothetical protein [Salegentibacter sp.]MDR9457428.1 hypothetical protein [Salegentibacter sp.]
MRYFLLFLYVVLFTACSTARLVESHSPYRAEKPKIEKILVIGMTPLTEFRESFETRLQKEFKKHDVEAVTSISVLNGKLTPGENTEQQLNNLEKYLLEEGYNTVLLSKIVQVESHKDLRNSLYSLRGSYRSFKSDYYANQGIFQGDDINSDTKVYHTETSIYTLPENRQRELLWQGEIDLKNPKRVKRTIKQYVDLLISSLKWDGVLP